MPFMILAGDIGGTKTNIGLFEGMFDRNALTFNPGWDAQCEPVGEFTDVRDLKGALQSQGMDVSADIPAGEGPGHIFLTDPDGNPILIDQHV